MKLVDKKFVNEFERELTILGIKFNYKKERKPEMPNKTIYTIAVGGLSFKFYKNRFKRIRKRNDLFKMTKDKKLFALVYAKCIRNFFYRNDTAETLILGSSTGRCSFIEDEKSVNMAIDAQDLYYSYQLFQKFEYQIPNLKNLVLYYDVFSAGNDLDNSPFKHFIPAFYKAFFDIPYKNKLGVIENNYDIFEKKIRSLNKYLTKSLKDIPYDLMPMQFGGLQTDAEFLTWAKAESKLAYKTTMNKYLKALLNKTQNLNVYIVLAPRHPIALSEYPIKEELFKELYEIVKNYNNVQIVNCFDNFEKTDFVDLLHLNMNGAKKITKIINENLKNNI